MLVLQGKLDYNWVHFRWVEKLTTELWLIKHDNQSAVLLTVLILRTLSAEVFSPEQFQCVSTELRVASAVSRYLFKRICSRHLMILRSGNTLSSAGAGQPPGSSVHLHPNTVQLDGVSAVHRNDTELSKKKKKHVSHTEGSGLFQIRQRGAYVCALLFILHGKCAPDSTCGL